MSTETEHIFRLLLTPHCPWPICLAVTRGRHYTSLLHTQASTNDNAHRIVSTNELTNRNAILGMVAAGTRNSAAYDQPSSIHPLRTTLLHHQGLPAPS